MYVKLITIHTRIYDSDAEIFEKIKENMGWGLIKLTIPKRLGGDIPQMYTYCYKCRQFSSDDSQYCQQILKLVKIKP